MVGGACVATRVRVMGPRQSRRVPGPFALRRSDHDYRCPSTTSLDSPGAEVGDLVGRDEP